MTDLSSFILATHPELGIARMVRMADFTDPKILQEWIEAAREGIGSTGDLLGVFEKLKKLFGKAQSADGSKTLPMEVRELIMELQEEVMAIRSANFELNKRVVTLAEELSRIQKFHADTENYARVELRRGNFAYRRKDAGRTHEPVPDVCAHCFEQATRIVTLQLKRPDFGFDVLQCTVCKTEVFKDNDVRAEHHAVPRRRALDDFTP